MGEEHGPRPRVHPNAEIAGEQALVGLRREDEGGDAEGLGIDAERQLRHGGVAGEGHLVDLVGGDASLLADILGEFAEGAVGEFTQSLECLGLEHRRADAADHVGTKRLLLVEHGRNGDWRARGQVHQRAHRRGRAQVEGDAIRRAGRIARFDGDEVGADHDGGDGPLSGAQGRADRAQHGRVDGELEVVEGLAHALDVGALVAQCRLVELDEPLLHGRAEDDLPAHADGCRLGTRGELGDIDRQVGDGIRHAGQAPALRELLRGEGPLVESADRHRPVGNAHLALLAGAVATAR